MVELPITLDGATEWEVKYIVWHRIFHENRQFLVLFAGFDISKAVWISEDKWGNAQQLWMEHKQSHGLS